MTQSFKNTLLGVAEILAFMPSAIDRFEGDKRTALRSFIYPVIFYPIILLAFSNRNDITNPATLAVHALVSWVGLFAFYAAVWWVTDKTDRRDRFWLFVNVSNCAWILSMGIFFVGVALYNISQSTFMHYWIFYLITELAYTAFVVAHTLKFPWQLGGFWAVVSLFISDIGFRAVMAFHNAIMP